MAGDVDIIDAMLSPIVPMSREQEEKAEVDISKMKSDTQILLAIFEKVVCIEHKLENKVEGYSPDPNTAGTNPVQLEL